MSAQHTPAQTAPASAASLPPPVSSAEIDASCRAPVMLLFVSSVTWLLIAAGFGMLALLKFHSPSFLADCPWFTYGRVHPAHLNGAVYGFAAQAGLGVLLWILAHLGRTRLAFAPGIVIGTIVWNLGVATGICAIFYGENTGQEWLEMPRYASVMLFSGYLLIGIGAMRTFYQRQDRPLFISQWFLLAAVFWFPWIYSTANLLLVAKPVRGAVQVVLDHWYINNLTVIWFGFIGLAAIFYFIPKITRRPLHSHYLGIFIFWTLALFGSWGGVAPGSPLPSWMAAMSTVAAVLSIVPVVAVAINVGRTIGGDYSALRAGAAGKFILVGTAVFIIAGLTAALGSLETVSEVTNFTWAMTAQQQLALYGFFAMTMFGAIYYIAPRLMGVEACPKLAGAHFVLAVLGLVFTVIPLALGGLNQGVAMNLHATNFPEVMLSTLTWLRVSTTGDLLLGVGNLLIFLNVIGLLYRVARSTVKIAWAANTAGTAGVMS